MSAIELVRIGPDDWREFREVRLASLLDAPAAFGSRHDDWVDAGEERWRARLTDVPLTLVARSEQGPVGVVSGAESDGAVELISMWVAPGRRGTGLAGRLIDAVVQWAEADGRATCLMVRDDNAPAITAYERAGFVDRGVPADWPADQPPERRMWRAVLSVLALLAFALGLGNRLRRRAHRDVLTHLVTSGRIVPGVITEIPEIDASSGGLIAPVTVRYADHHGTDRWVQKVGQWKRAGLPRVGDPATVLFDPADPGNTARIWVGPPDSRTVDDFTTWHR